MHADIPEDEKARLAGTLRLQDMRTRVCNTLPPRKAAWRRSKHLCLVQTESNNIWTFQKVNRDAHLDLAFGSALIIDAVAPGPERALGLNPGKIVGPEEAHRHGSAPGGLHVCGDPGVPPRQHLHNLSHISQGKGSTEGQPHREESGLSLETSLTRANLGCTTGQQHFLSRHGCVHGQS